MAHKEETYWSKSWELLTRDKGWYKPLLVLAAAQIVPIVGAFGADGYALEWARLTSWGVDSSPKQKNVDIGACIKSGARAFVVALGYGFVIAAVRMILSAILGPAIGGLLSAVLGLAGMVIVAIAKLRATIYQNIGAGYQVERIIDMIKRDTNGVLRITGLAILLGLGVSAVAVILYGIVLIPKLGGIVIELMRADAYGYVDEYALAGMMITKLGEAMPLLFVFSYPVAIAAVFMNLILNTSVGLWMRQFDVQNWGKSSDPLPGTATPAEPAASDWQATAEPAQSAQPVVQPAEPVQPAAQPVSPVAPPAETAAQPAVPVAPVAPSFDDAAQTADAPASPKSFTLDDMVPADEPAPQVEDLSDEVTMAVETPEVKTFTLDDVAAPAGEPDELSETAQIEEPEQPVVVVEEQIEEQVEETAPVAQADDDAPAVKTFTLDDVVEEEAPVSEPQDEATEADPADEDEE
ncbi:MAG: DUF4013 domain-containing protein [Atopobiaceae bacterium]|nr:DUF4013 domain-containing protein [Atopobiaceae bacterium]